MPGSSLQRAADFEGRVPRSASVVRLSWTDVIPDADLSAQTGQTPAGPAWQPLMPLENIGTEIFSTQRPEAPHATTGKSTATSPKSPELMGSPPRLSQPPPHPAPPPGTSRDVSALPLRFGFRFPSSSGRLFYTSTPRCCVPVQFAS